MKTYKELNILLHSFPDMVCFNCKRLGHKKWACPLRKNTGRRREKRRGNKGGGAFVNIYLIKVCKNKKSLCFIKDVSIQVLCTIFCLFNYRFGSALYPDALNMF